LPARLPVHESVELPDPPLMLVEESAQVKFVEFVVTVRETVAENPLIARTLIVDVPAVPLNSVMSVGIADMEKSAAAVT
jgi:hypothetical protein